MDSDSAENQVSADGVKEVLAPAEGPRENLINTAVKFLQNPKVMTSPLYQKKAFLEKKGLTQVEIDLAVQRAGVVEAASAASPVGSANHVGQTGPVQVYQPAVGQPHYVPIPPQSGWARARDVAMTTVVVASVSYAVYQLFEKYLRPWLLGKSDQERRLDRLEQELRAIQSVQDSLTQISGVLATIQASLAEQQKQSLASRGELEGISNLKADIASLKGLMLNKNQFPALPTTAPILPSWQRAPQASSTTPSASSLTSTPSSWSSKAPASPSTAASVTSVPQTGVPSDQVNGQLSEHSVEEKREAKSESVKDSNLHVSQEQTEQRDSEMASSDEGGASINDMDKSEASFAGNGSVEVALSSEA
ncbi:hypothetical protein EGW08_021193 [Elysia chlorotica]|uniref:Peroxisomal membrane protein PEX14 n=1 Tax=Elysia chlorotica TaxID=188477 RepID=A0A433SP65_ELYCH|nr:hypothetical protein EGW08_021193 [Elysia chlorotica]